MNSSYNEVLESNTKLLQECYEFWGEDAQLRMVIEEMAELTKEICKWFRGDNNYSALMKETVDVLIMVNQLLVIAKFPESDFKNLIKLKLSRIERRLNEERLTK